MNLPRYTVRWLEFTALGKTETWVIDRGSGINPDKTLGLTAMLRDYAGDRFEDDTGSGAGPDAFE